MKRKYIILEKFQVIAVGISIAILIIASCRIVSREFLKAMQSRRKSPVADGKPQKEIKIGSVIWTGSFKRSEPDLATAYLKIQEDLNIVTKYLIGKGINEKDLTFSKTSTETIYKKDKNGSYTNNIQEYRLTQSLRIRSREVSKVIQVSQDAAELTKYGIDFVSNPPEYF